MCIERPDPTRLDLEGPISGPLLRSTARVLDFPDQPEGLQGNAREEAGTSAVR